MFERDNLDDTTWSITNTGYHSKQILGIIQKKYQTCIRIKEPGWCNLVNHRGVEEQVFPRQKEIHNVVLPRNRISGRKKHLWKDNLMWLFAMRKRYDVVQFEEIMNTWEDRTATPLPLQRLQRMSRTWDYFLTLLNCWQNYIKRNRFFYI